MGGAYYCFSSQYIFCIIIYCDNLTSIYPSENIFFSFQSTRDYAFIKFWEGLINSKDSVYLQDNWEQQEHKIYFMIQINIKKCYHKCKYTSIFSWKAQSKASDLLLQEFSSIKLNIKVDEQDDEGLSKWSFTLKTQK